MVLANPIQEILKHLIMYFEVKQVVFNSNAKKKNRFIINFKFFMGEYKVFFELQDQFSIVEVKIFSTSPFHCYSSIIYLLTNFKVDNEGCKYIN